MTRIKKIVSVMAIFTAIAYGQTGPCDDGQKWCATNGRMNGTWWNIISYWEKVGFYLGIEEVSYAHALQKFEQADASFVVVEKLNKFYKDPKNLRIPILEALIYMALRGNS
jgi:hypothetical protein